MLEQFYGRPVAQEGRRSTFLIRRIIPHPLTIKIADRFLGEGLTGEGHSKLRSLVKRMLSGEEIRASREVPEIFKDLDFRFIKEGEENIPDSGATLFIGNHTRGGPLFGMGQYFEAARTVYEMRVNVEDEDLREPVAIAQRGLTKATKLPGGIKIVWNAPFTGQFYDLAADALNWITVYPPKFDAKGQITNRQNLPRWVLTRLVAGGALLWFPQGKHQHPDQLEMPGKSTGLLTKLKDEDVKVVAMRFVPGQNSLSMFFSDAVHIGDIPQREGRVDMNAFVDRYLKPLGENSK